MIKIILRNFIILGLFLLGTVEATELKSTAPKRIGGTIAATLQQSGSFQPIRGEGYTIGTPVLIQPLIFGLSMGFAIPITFDTPFSEIPSIVATYESNVTTLTGATSPYFGQAVDNLSFAVNQITGISVSDVTPQGCVLHVGLFINGRPNFPNVQTAIAQFAQYGFALNFIAKK
jgi:hypothetical protein